MKTVGITGGIGSGKSTVCRMLEERGARVFYADVEAKRLMQENAQVREELIEAFGAESYDAEGHLNRAYLAAQVFGDKGNLARINRIVHPRVFEAFEAARKQAEQDGIPLLVKEAALIFETGGDRHLDAVVVVDAPQQERVRRVVERDGVSPEQVLGRIGHQLPAEELRRRADFVIENDGTLETLEAQVQQVYDTLAE